MIRNKLNDLLFNSTFGRILCFVVCVFLFAVTLGIGYIVIGLVLASYLIKRGSNYGGSGDLGVVIWPILIAMHITERN